MRIVVNHLTRMQRGFICVAGLDMQTRQHVRPVMQRRLSTDFLLRQRGPFEMAHEVDHRHALSVRTLKPGDFWNLLRLASQPHLSDIFGAELSATEFACSVPSGQGKASLGCMVPVGRPTLYSNARLERADQIRMRFSDGVLRVDAAVTDIRLFANDYVTPDLVVMKQVNERIQAGIGVILSIGLTRPFTPSPERAPQHWLQVNNIHLEDNPNWALG
jgi:hypothetical protein